MIRFETNQGDRTIKIPLPVWLTTTITVGWIEQLGAETSRYSTPVKEQLRDCNVTQVLMLLFFWYVEIFVHSEHRCVQSKKEKKS